MKRIAKKALDILIIGGGFWIGLTAMTLFYRSIGH